MTSRPVAALLEHWFAGNRRDLPWRRSADPYRVWLSEIMLQQTRVDQAIPYYERFLAAFPDVRALAGAPEDAVLKCWEGLGYYSRARNLQAAARVVAARPGARFPEQYEDLLELPGIGPYTAAAIASICFSVRKGVVDGNVLRVASRFLNLLDDVTRPETRRQIQAWADSLAEAADDVGNLNQALMELGATVCTPGQPACERCPLRIHCAGYAAGTAASLPRKAPKKAVPTRLEAAVVLLNPEGEVWVEQRAAGALLGGLWKFPTLDVDAGATATELESAISARVPGALFAGRLDELRHAYSHFKIRLLPFVFHGRHPDGATSLRPDRLEHLAFDVLHRRLAEQLKPIIPPAP